MTYNYKLQITICFVFASLSDNTVTWSNVFALVQVFNQFDKEKYWVSKEKQAC